MIFVYHSSTTPFLGQTSQLLTLAKYTDDPNPAVTRILFTENDLHARGYVCEFYIMGHRAHHEHHRPPPDTLSS